MSNDTRPTSAVIAANPEAYGFSWNTETLHKAGSTLPNCPTMEHKDEAKLRSTFGETYFIEMANGTSGRVRDQEVARTMIYENRNVDRMAVKIAIVDRAFGIRVRKAATVIKVQSWLANDGTEFTDKAECMAYNASLTA